ncbi:regulator of nonsense transcripts 3A isoform X2 [Xiphophorus maculatus]|uniref:regulator of nonsense transcripts 3A isoform X2 n=1 Tax=Xiphophorus maculatus TaxID=8083 RepID=UPI0003B56D4A|nr:regulator of nonsense transcripts 3A isoform X2 [Xiphophorus maculatus]XP_032423036.1 regulator of nonsense transcripts 3A-like isoform X2 [Xiphophorus hellerii]
MRSDKDQMTAGKEKSIFEIQLKDVPREQENIPANAKPKEEKKEVFTKVVIRRLPPNLSKEQLEEHLSPLPSYDYFEFFPADQSLYPHLFSRAYINFKSTEDILLFRDRFDGYVFIDNKGQEYPAVVEFAPFQKISKKKLKKKDAKAGSIEEDPEYKRFLENYSCDEEKSMANPEILLGEIEAKTRELIAKRTTPLLEYIKNKKIEKQRIREEKREERRRRELEKKRQREEEKRKRREEERRKRKEAEKQKKLSDKDIKIKLLKKSDRDDDVDSDRMKEKSEPCDAGVGKWEKTGGQMKSKEPKEKGQAESDKEQRDQHGRRQRDKDHRGKDEERKRQRHHYEFDKFMRRKDETKWGKGYCQDRAKKEGHHHGYSYCPDGADKMGKEDREDLSNRKERLRNKVSEKDRPAMQLYQPGARNRKRMSSANKGYDCLPIGHSPECRTEHCYEVVAMTAGIERGFEKSKDEQ